MERETFIKQNFVEKKGRNVGFTQSNMNCYLSIDSPTPNLAFLTGLFLDEISQGMYSPYGFAWARDWDKSIICMSPDRKIKCDFIPDSDPRRKIFVPISTTKTVDTQPLLKDMPVGELALININSQPTTIDGFLITYFHMVNELIWDLMLEMSSSPSSNVYNEALKMVLERGFSVGTMTEDEIIRTKVLNTRNSIRIYGSSVNKFVPEIMGMIIRK